MLLPIERGCIASSRTQRGDGSARSPRMEFIVAQWLPAESGSSVSKPQGIDLSYSRTALLIQKFLHWLIGSRRWLYSTGTFIEGH